MSQPAPVVAIGQPRAEGRPRSVTWGVALLYLAAVLDLPLAATHYPENAAEFSHGAAVVLWGMAYLLVASIGFGLPYLIARRKSTARVACTILVVIDVAVGAHKHFGLTATPQTLRFLGAASAALGLVGILLLYQRDARAWFQGAPGELQ